MHNNQINKIVSNAKQRRIMKRVVAVLCVLTVFLTSTVLRHEVIAKSHVATCGYPDHEHTKDCFSNSGELLCNLHVHTDACYQTVAYEPLEEAPEEIEIELGDDSEMLEPVPEEIELVLGDSDTAMDEEPTYAIRDRQVVLLSEMLGALNLNIDGIVSVEQVVDDDDIVYIDIQNVGKDYEIRPLTSFDEIELAIGTKDDIVLIRLTDAQYIEEEIQEDEVESTLETVEDTIEIQGEDKAETIIINTPSVDDADATTENETAEDEPEAVDTANESEADAEGETVEDELAEVVNTPNESDAEKEGETIEEVVAEAIDTANESNAEVEDDTVEVETEVTETPDESQEDTESSEGLKEIAEDESTENAETTDENITDTENSEAAKEADGDEVAEDVNTIDEGEAGTEDSEVTEETVEDEAVSAAEPTDEGEADAEDSETTEETVKDETVSAAEPTDESEAVTEDSETTEETVSAAEPTDESEASAEDSETTEETIEDEIVSVAEPTDEGEAVTEDSETTEETVEEETVSAVEPTDEGEAGIEDSETTEETVEEETVSATEPTDEGEAGIEDSEATEETVSAAEPTDESEAGAEDSETTEEIVEEETVPAAEPTDEGEAGTEDSEVTEETVEDETVSTAEPTDEGEAITEDSEVTEEAVEDETVSAVEPTDEGEAETEEESVEPELEVTDEEISADAEAQIDAVSEFSYTFNAEGCATLSAILASLGMDWDIATCDVRLPEDAPVTVEAQEDPADYILTAKDYFDAVIMTLDSEEESVEISLANPQPVIQYTTGEALKSEDGRVSVVFEQDVRLPEGTALTVKDIEPELSEETQEEIREKLSEALGGSRFNVIWLDISLGDVHDIPATVTIQNAAVFGVQTVVVHITHEGKVEIIRETRVDEDGSLTFAVNGFSPMGVATVQRMRLTLRSASPIASGNGWSLDVDGTLTITGNISYTSAEAYLWNRYKEQIKKVVVAEGVTAIGANAFYGFTQLQSVDFGDNTLVIGEAAFRGCSNLTEVTGTANITSIERSVFRECKSLTHIEFGDALTSVGNHNFRDCSALTSVDFGEGETSLTLGTYNFSGCAALTDVAFHNRLKEIGDYSFNGCAALEHVEFGSNLKTITGNSNFFMSCNKLETVDFGNSAVAIPDRLFLSHSTLKEVKGLTNVTSVGEDAFSGCSQLTSLEFGENLESLNGKAFTGCTQLASVDLGGATIAIGASTFSGLNKLTEIKGIENITEIGESAFKGTRLTEITIPEGVTTIGKTAFEDCDDLERINIPASVKNIGDNAFRNCEDLEAVSFEKFNQMKTLPEGLFSGCESLTQVDLPIGLTEISKNMFMGCASLEKVTLPNLVTKIGANAFKNCAGLTEATLPKYIKEIGANAFENTALTTVEFEKYKYLEKIGKEAYKGSKLLSVELPETVTELGSGAFQNCAELVSADLEKAPLTSLLSNTFDGCNNLEALSLPDTMEEISTGTFRGCTNLTSIGLPASLKTIGESAFSGCKNIVLFDGEEGILNLPDTLTSIGKSAFYGCEGIVEVNVGENVTTMGESVFSGCANLEKATVDAAITAIPGSTFFSCAKLKEATFGNSENITAIGSSAFSGCKKLSDFDIPENVTVISGSAFYQCAALSGIELPDTLTKIGSSAFSSCTALASVTFENENPSPLEIVTSAFNGCTALTEIRFPSTLTSIGETAFNGCTALRTIAFEDNGPGNLKTIGKSAFNGCTALTEAHFPAAVTSIGETAFNGCTGLTTVTFQDNDTIALTIGTSAFYGCTKITGLDLPTQLKSVGTTAFNNCDGLTYVNFTNGSADLTIGTQAFNDCDYILSVAFPKNLISIAERGFSSCDRLQTTTFQDGDKALSLENRAFSNCKNLIEVIFPKNISYIKGGTSASQGAYYNCTSLSRVEFTEGGTYDLTIGTYAFRNAGIQEIEFPENLIKIETYAFQNSGLSEVSFKESDRNLVINQSAFITSNYLTEVTIPKNVTQIDASVFNDCRSLQTMIWDAPNLATIGSFTSNTSFTLVIGEHVDEITDDVLNKLYAGGANALVFKGDNDFKLPSLGGKGFPRPLDDLTAGDYHADSDGALYKIENGEATLVYVPDGLSSYTLKASLPADNGGSYPVTGVASNALYAARALTSLTITAPQSLTNIAPYAFANARKLANVNGETTKAGAESLFSTENMGIRPFHNTALTEGQTPVLPVIGQDSIIYGSVLDESRQPTELSEEDRANGWVSTLGVKITQSGASYRGAAGDRESPGALERDADGKYLLYTGEGLETVVEVTNPSSEGVTGGDLVRVYFQMDEGGLLNYTVGTHGIEQYTHDENGKKIPQDDLNMTVRETDVPGVICVEFDRPKTGSTANVVFMPTFTSPTTRGGDLVVWAEYVDSAHASIPPVAHVPPNKHQVLNYATKPDNFPLVKTASESTNRTVTADADGRFYISGQTYTINMSRSGSILDVGKDHMTSADFVDTFQLPQEIMVNPKLIEEIKNHRITVSSSSSGSDASKRTTYTFTSPTCGSILTFADSTDKGNFVAPVLTTVKDASGRDTLRLVWKLHNTTYDAYRKSTSQSTFREIENHIVTMTVNNKVLCLDMAHAQPDTEYTITNAVDVTEHFCYSEDQTDSDEASYNLVTGNAVVQFTKSAASSAVRGSYHPFTLKVESKGVMPITLKEFTTIEEKIDQNSQDFDLHYIDAEGIWSLLTDNTHPFGQKQLSDCLRLTISRAHLYGYGNESVDILNAVKKPVITENDNPATTSRENTGYQTPYSGTSSSDPADVFTDAVFTFWKEDGAVYYSLKKAGAETALRSGTLSNAQDIQTLFDDVGFFVTRNTRYDLIWNLAPLGTDFQIPGGENLTITIPTRLKDVFMRLGTDKRYYENYSNSNKDDTYSISHNKAALKKGGNDVKASAPGYMTTHDAELTKGVTGVAGSEQIVEYTGTGQENQTWYEVVQYNVRPQHLGSATYDLMPVTDHMTDRQALLVPAVENEGADWAAGLETYELNGVTYYELNQTGTYHRVYTGDRWADHVEVAENGTHNYDTKIFWYLEDFGGNYNSNGRRDIVYKARVYQNDYSLNGRIASGTNESWLGDHQTHRLYAATSFGYGVYLAEAKIRAWDKRIVEYVGDTRDGTDYCAVTKGRSVVYRLRFFGNPRFTLTGEDFYDVLPKYANADLKWKVSDIKIDYDGLQTNGVDWTLVNHSPADSQQRINWPANFEMTCTNDSGIGYIYVTLTFPDGTEWDTYVQKYTNTMLDNTLYVKNTAGVFDYDRVYHDLADKAVVRLQKGVYATGAWREGNDGYRKNVDSRWTYDNNDALTQKVYYYITLYNGGYTNLYLNPLQDVLPKGYTLVTGTYGRAPRLMVTNMYETSPATVSKDPNFKVNTTYLDPNYSTLGYTVTDLGDGHQRVTLTLKPGVYDNGKTKQQKNDHTGSEKWYLAPGQAAVIRLECLTNEYEDTEDESTNIVTMPFEDFYHTGLNISNSTSTSTSISGVPKQPDKNDGGCDITTTVEMGAQGVDTSGFDNATQWLESDVTLTRGFILPGIQKTLVKRITTQDQVAYAPAAVNPQDTLVWGVSAVNGGGRTVTDYVITDDLPAPYNFVGDVTIKQSFNLIGDTEPTSRLLFTVERTAEGTGRGRYVTDDVTLVMPDGERVDLTLGQAEATLVNWHGKRVFVRIDRDAKTGDEVMSLRFPDKDMGLPAGGEVYLEYTSKYILQKLVNKLVLNKAYITPLAQTWTGTSNYGNIVEYQTPYAENTKSVRDTAQVVATYGGSTSSLKAIREKEVPANKTDSQKTPNYITVRDKSRLVTYSLSVKNTNFESIKKLVLIDNLPEPGDFTVFDANDKRESPFTLQLAEDPNFVVTVKTEKGETRIIRTENYTVEWMGKVEVDPESNDSPFTSNDWSGLNADGKWYTLDENTVLSQVRAIRVIFTDNTGELYQSYDELFVDFDAQIVGDAEPGDIAYNGFGYRFTLQKSGISAEASPRIVGVRIPDLPHIKKSLVNSRGNAFTAEKDEIFEYILYSGNAISFAAFDEETVVNEIKGANRDYVKISVPVSQGNKKSTEYVSFNGKQGYLDGDYEHLADWVMDDQASYTLVELSQADYSPVSLGNQTNNYTFTFNAKEGSLEINSVNRHRDWSFRLQKQDQFERPVENAKFAVYSQLMEEKMSAEDYAALNDATILQEITREDKTWYLMRIANTNGQGFFRLDELTGPAYYYIELSAPAVYDATHYAEGKVTRPDANVIQMATAANTYLASGTVHFEVGKDLLGRELGDQEFTFKLEGYDPIGKAVITDPEKMPPMPAENIEVSNNAEGRVVFGDIALTQDDIGKTYCYSVTEVIPASPEERMVYDTTRGIIRATVVDLGNGKVGVQQAFTRMDPSGQEPNWDATFHNVYESQTSISLPVRKVVSGTEWPEGEVFRFELVADESQGEPLDPTPVVVQASNPDTLNIVKNYDQNDDGKTYHYILREIVPGVAVACDRNGKTVKFKRNPNSLRETLKYADYMAMSAEELETYGLAGKTFKWKANGLEYDAAQHQVVVSVNYEETESKGVRAHVTVDGQALTEAATIFTNTFAPDPKEARIEVDKAIEGRPFISLDAYTFKLIPDNLNQPLPEPDTITIVQAPEGMTPSEEFVVPLSWSAMGDQDEVNFDYTIVEVTPDGKVVQEGDRFDQVTYDHRQFRVRIHVTRDRDTHTMNYEVLYGTPEGGFSADKEYIPEFKNTYETDPVPFAVTVEKQLNDKPAFKGEYTFGLYDENDERVETITVDAQDGKPVSEEVDDVKLTEGEHRTYYLLEDIPPEAVAWSGDAPVVPEVTYGTGEHRDDHSVWKLNGITYDTTRINVQVVANMDWTYHLVPKVTYTRGADAKQYKTAQFKNTYEAAGEAGITLDKSIDGRKYKDGENFEFVLTPLEGAPMNTEDGPRTELRATTGIHTTDADGRHKAVNFPKILYDIADITEETGEIETHIFRYKLREVIPNDATVTIDGGETLKYSDANEEEKSEYDGKWTYEGMTYAAERTISIQVEDQNGALKVTCLEGDTIRITNSYRAVPISVNLKAGKLMLADGVVLPEWKHGDDPDLDWSHKTFTFKLKPKALTNPRPEAGGDTVDISLSNKKESLEIKTGEIFQSIETPVGVFGDIVFTQPGTYEYTIEEVLPDGLSQDNPYSPGENLAYDAEPRTVRVEVFDDTQDGSQLRAKVTYIVEDHAEAVVIKNEELTEHIRISVKKQWMLNGQINDNPEGNPITVHLYQLSANDQWLEIDSETKTSTPPETRSKVEPFTIDHDHNWELTIEGLKNYGVIDGHQVVYKYYLVEEPVVGWTVTYSDGIHEPQGEGGASALAFNGNGNLVITNSKSGSGAIALPATGGPGTTLFTASGITFIALALALLLRKRRA